MYLQIDRISVDYPGRRGAISEVSLGLPQGALGALVGPSGGGKTSLLRAIAGLERPSTGRITLDGAVVTDVGRGIHVAPERRRIGMVFQDYALFPHLDLAANVGFGLARWTRTERAAQVQRMLELVGLGDAGRRYPHQISGGQQQRVALARALAPQPRLLLLDEPFSSLDAELRERLAQELVGILKAAGTTALFVTHDQAEAFGVADWVGVVAQGRLEQWDAPASVYRRPVSRFVAGFIGRGAFVPARRLAGDRGGFETPVGIVVDDLQGGHVAPGEACDLLLRAEDLHYDPDSPVRAEVVGKTYRGGELLYDLRLPGGEHVLALVLARHDFAVGAWIGVRADVLYPVTFDRVAA